MVLKKEIATLLVAFPAAGSNYLSLGLALTKASHLIDKDTNILRMLKDREVSEFRQKPFVNRHCSQFGSTLNMIDLV